MSQRSITAAVTGALVCAFSPDLLACGGLFCNGAQPVVQAGEGIVFSIDEETNTVDAVINIQYEGEAADFAWLLPLQSEPLELRVAPTFLFATVDNLTAPQFVVSTEFHDSCGEVEIPPPPPAPPPSAGGVEVLSREAVGPYDSVVIQSSDPMEVQTWLETNGYAVTQEMIDTVVPYLARGDALLALKLTNGKTAGDIQPIWVKMLGGEVCVPIRLTAIAALEDMDITVFVMSNQGRAIPENYFHVDLNLPRIDWMRGGSNYRQLVAEAADQGTGNAFVTEFSGSLRRFNGRLEQLLFNRTMLGTITDAAALINELANESLTVHPEVASLLLEQIGAENLASRGVTVDQFMSCPACVGFMLEGLPVDGAVVAEGVWQRVVQPLDDLEAMFDAKTTGTRLYTLISPEEMTIDPEFIFRSDLPAIDNIHRATALLDCRGGDSWRTAPISLTIEETDQVVTYHQERSGYEAPYVDALPAAVRVEQLAEGLLVEDHRRAVDEVLEEHRLSFPGVPGMDPNDPPPNTNNGGRSSMFEQSCACSAVHTSGAPWGLALAALLLISRRRRH